MIDQEITKAIQLEIEKAFTVRDKQAASGLYFQQSTGRAFNGTNLYGVTGDRVIHNSIRTNLTDQTIRSGVINFTSSDIRIYTESSASSDDLDTINANPIGQGSDLLIIRPGDDADTVVVKNNTGNIQCAGDFVMDTLDHRMILQWDRINAYWVEISRTDAADIDWTTWSPTYSTNGAMTYGTITTSYARYKKVGTTVFFQIKAVGTTAVAGTTQLRFTLPVTPLRDTADGFGGGCIAIDGAGVYISGHFAHSGTSNTVAVARYDFANWGLGTDRGFIISGFYEIA